MGDGASWSQYISLYTQCLIDAILNHHHKSLFICSACFVLPFFFFGKVGFFYIYFQLSVMDLLRLSGFYYEKLHQSIKEKYL